MAGSLYVRNGVWYLLHYQDALNKDNRIYRRRVAEQLGRFDTRELARAEADRRMQQIQPEIHPGMTVREFVARAFIPKHVSELKRGTQRAQRDLLRLHILPALGEEKIANVRTQHIQRLITLTKLSAQTKRHVKHCCSSLFRLAIREGVYQGQNPAQEISIPPGTRKPRYALSAEQVKALMEILPSPARELMLLGCTTSSGRAELLALRYGAVNLTDEPVIYQTYSIPGHCLLVIENYYEKTFGTPKTGPRERICPLADIVVERLARMKAAAQWTEPQDVIFVSSRRGIPLLHNNLSRRVFAPASRKLGLNYNIGFHTFRRTFITLANQTGWDVMDVISSAGHSDLKMNAHYNMKDLARRAEATNRLADKLGVATSEDDALACY